jgi:WD40 repeat protein
LTASLDRTARVWAFTEEEPARLTAMKSGPVAALSADGEFAAAADGEAGAALWSLKSGERVRAVEKFDGFVTALAFAPDRTSLAGGDAAGQVRVCALVDGLCGPPIGAFEGEAVALAYTPDGKTLAGAGKDGSVKFWSFPGGKLEREHQSSKWWGVSAIAVSPDAKLFALVGAEDNFIPVCDARTGQCPEKFASERALTSVAFSAEGATAITGGCAEMQGAACKAGEVILWSVASQKPLKTLAAHGGAVTAVAFSPDNSYFASAASDGSVVLWSPVADGPVMIFDSLESSVTNLVFAADGALLVARAENGKIAVWPLRPRIFKAPGEELLAAALQETGLALEGFDLSLAPSSSNP